MSTTIKLVLDTNVVLDWLIFNDPAMNSLREGVQEGRILLHTHEPARAELQRVLNYPALQLSAAQQAEIFAHYQRQTTSATLPGNFSLQNLLLPTGFPRCRDPDDQHFLALAFHTQTDALVSRDRALLALQKRAGKFGLIIVDTKQMIDLLACGASDSQPM